MVSAYAIVGGDDGDRLVHARPELSRGPAQVRALRPSQERKKSPGTESSPTTRGCAPYSFVCGKVTLTIGHEKSARQMPRRGSNLLGRRLGHPPSRALALSWVSPENQSKPVDFSALQSPQPAKSEYK